MTKGRIFTSSYPENVPDWYWTRSLHDACILGVETFEFPFDYRKFAVEKDSYVRNALVLKIDASGAMFETEIKEIRFLNYKVLSQNISLQGRKKVWWLADRLTQDNGRYTLEIDMQDLDAFPEDFTFKLQFDRAEVKRG